MYENGNPKNVQKSEKGVSFSHTRFARMHKNALHENIDTYILIKTLI